MADTVTTESFLGDGSEPTTASATTPSIWFNESEVTSIDATPGEEFSITESVLNTIDVKELFHSKSPDTSTVFEAFIIIEIVMTALELIIWTVAAIKLHRWRKNYRNQMLLQLSVVRFMKRLVFLAIFFRENGVISSNSGTDVFLLYLEIYVDFVIVILVFFFIKHMYDSLIVVLVKISETSLCRVLTCSWLVPVPVSGACTTVIATGLLDQWLVYLLTCCLFRWPLILLGTILYLTILYKVLNDKIRKFARSLTVMTFLMCLLINFYLFSKDVIELWCLKSFVTLLTSYISGFLMNILILSFYIILIMLNFKCNMKSSDSIPNCSISIDR